ncbi:hypothetical protein GWI72_00985 [Microvirga tunisiensis]|uniref:Uncharacterized protein n=1 Tax=Pannonibacter tanglangensis TaxID=2750084 RepID=A0A7X5EZ67_9HYPH|nr:hypothetical protein [Pannonibacter sp. XCT-53]NBN76837.1 hypothetical protein [Pannonibacter sp. XCT-53]
MMELDQFYSFFSDLYFMSASFLKENYSGVLSVFFGGLLAAIGQYWSSRMILNKTVKMDRILKAHRITLRISQMLSWLIHLQNASTDAIKRHQESKLDSEIWGYSHKIPGLQRMITSIDSSDYSVFIDAKRPDLLSKIEEFERRYNSIIESAIEYYQERDFLMPLVMSNQFDSQREAWNINASHPQFVEIMARSDALAKFFNDISSCVNSELSSGAAIATEMGLCLQNLLKDKTFPIIERIAAEPQTHG